MSAFEELILGRLTAIIRCRRIHLVAVLGLAACGRIGFEVAADSVSADACAFGPWQPAVHLDALASADNDWDLGVSPDGKTYIFSRFASVYDIYRADVVNGQLQSASLDVSLSSSDYDAGPSWNARGDRLYFASDRGNPGSVRLYTAMFDGTSFGPPAIIPELSTREASSPCVSRDELELFFTAGSPVSVHRAVRAQTADPWQYDRRLDELGADAGYSSLSPDGLTIYFTTRRDGDRAIYSATRSSRTDPFPPPHRETDLSPSGIETSDAELSPDSKTMYFASNRLPSQGLYDLFSTSRACQ
jgi:Tol biopolymer transport system component